MESCCSDLSKFLLCTLSVPAGPLCWGDSEGDSQASAATLAATRKLYKDLCTNGKLCAGKSALLWTERAGVPLPITTCLHLLLVSFYSVQDWGSLIVVCWTIPPTQRGSYLLPIPRTAIHGLTFFISWPSMFSVTVYFIVILESLYYNAAFLMRKLRASIK